MSRKWSRKETVQGEGEGILTDVGWANEEKIRIGLSLNEQLLHLPRLSVATLPQRCPAPTAHAATPHH